MKYDMSSRKETLKLIFQFYSLNGSATNRPCQTKNDLEKKVAGIFTKNTVSREDKCGSN